MKDLANLGDEALLRRSADGDAEAFTILYRRRQGPLYRFALQMSGSATVAEEVTQDVFLLLIRQPEQFDPSRGSVSAFLYGVARNHVLRHLKLSRLYVAEQPDVAVDGDLAADVERNHRVDRVRRAVLALPERYREVVVLCDLHEMSYAEAAEVAGCAVGTIRSRLNRARGLLAARLSAETDATRCMA